MKILIVKLSSLGDVLHTLPVVHDIHQAVPDAQIDWVVEEAFADVVRRCQGVNRVITCDIRTWRKTLFSEPTHTAFGVFRQELKQTNYDAVIDLQGLTKSAWVAWMACLTVGGKRYALANRTDGASYEVPTRWVADVAIRVEPHSHAVQRGRQLCAIALGYALTEEVLSSPSFGLIAHINKLLIDTNNIANSSKNDPQKSCVIFAHGASRADKLWPVTHWATLGHRLNAQGFMVALAHGSATEEERSQHIAQQLGQAMVLPRLNLDDLIDTMSTAAGVIGVDSGLSHMAVALNVPHVQIYNVDTAWRTGPIQPNTIDTVGTLTDQKIHQTSVYAQPTPSVDSVWQAWQSLNTVDTKTV